MAPLMLRPRMEGLDVVEWARLNLDFIERELLAHGAILFRDFAIESVDKFEQLAKAISPDLVEYFERTVRRQTIKEKIYTASEYPADHPIPLHNEYSFAHEWPLKLWFYCATPPSQGGATLIADGRQVFNLIAPRIREKFIQKNVIYSRNYGDGLDLTWEEAFQTGERAQVEKYCSEANILFEWKDGNRLRTRQVRQAVANHVKTGEAVWFNQVHLFHVSSLEPTARQSLTSFFGAEALPRHAFYGDGSPIEPSDLAEIHEAYRQATVAVQWKQGDAMLLDNMLVAHGRAPFAGSRTILVTMAELITNQDFRRGGRQ